MKMTEKEWQVELGQHLRNLRLRQNLDQREVAKRAPMALNAVKNLESGKGATVESLIKALRVLGREDWLDTLAPRVSISPLQMLKSSAPRQRVSSIRARSHV
jgi:transcriptional regulator with XRE-family HTH domain